MSFRFLLQSTDQNTAARRGTITTAHGKIETPTFMHVGTFGSVRSLNHFDLEELGAQIILGNTYHLWLKPGPEVLKTIGSYHKMIHWNRPILTDSGGFQVFSLPRSRTIEEKGATFKSYIDNSYKFLSPEVSVEFQELIGSDIMMVLDVCVPSTSSRDVAAEAMQRTHRWAKRSRAAKKRTDNAQFGIVQGAIYEDLRKESIDFITECNFEGVAIGGLAVGETDAEREHFTEFVASKLPTNKPRYLMGVGTPYDLIRSIRAGVDMFDCIIPTNHAHQGLAYTWNGKVHLRRRFLETDLKPIDETCGCKVCGRFSRAYLHQLVRSFEPTGYALVSYHNSWFYEDLMKRAREAIVKNEFKSFAENFLRTEN